MAASPTSMATPQRASAASCFKDAPLTHVFLSALVKGVFQAVQEEIRHMELSQGEGVGHTGNSHLNIPPSLGL